MANILTEVITSIVNEKLKQKNGFGVSIVNLPEIDFIYFANHVDNTETVELYFLGYNQKKEDELRKIFICRSGISIHFTVEEAEKSRNIGADDVFRIHFIKNSELEKISSLKWYEIIDVDLVYKNSCRYVQKIMDGTNETIKALLQALSRKDIRALLNFERVLEYLNVLLEARNEDLSSVVENQIYRLGLLMNPGFCTGNPGVEFLKDSIKRNYDVVRRISTLEKTDRHNIANYSSKHPEDKIVRWILEYYNTPNVNLLEKMVLSDVQGCLKTFSDAKKSRKSKRTGHNQSSIAAEILFEEQDELIDTFIETASSKIDERPDKNKALKISVEANGRQIDFAINPTTEKIVEMSAEKNKWGAYIYADVENPQMAIDDSEKYRKKYFDDEYIAVISSYLGRAQKFSEAKEAAEGIIHALTEFLTIRKEILPYSIRLQDMPILQVIQKNKDFITYLESYERLIFSLKNGYTPLYELDSLGAKQVISSIVALDFVYIIGRENSHAIPTSLNPLYLWKYIKLAQELLEARGVSEGNESYLSENDKDFIMRKAEEIPDPLALVMLPRNSETSIECLPYVGRIGNLPIYSSMPQISDNKTGMMAVCQNIVRYMCLYPHSSMLLHLCIINPPSVELVVTMLKELDKDKGFSSFGDVGIDLTIYRTKETSADWLEIQDKALNEGMLGRLKGNNNEKFYLSVKNKCMSYSEIIEDISKEQHVVIIFDPNERSIEIARNDRNIHIHPLCVPKVYEYNKMRGDVRVRPANEGGMFSDYATIIEKLYEQPSTFGHRNVFVNTPIKKETYEQLLKKADWLIILDPNLKSWDISLQSVSERLFFRNDDNRSIGIYSKNSSKFVRGYREIISSLGNYTPNEIGIENIVSETRVINDDGLLSIVSHTTNRIFDQRHGKGSLGLALAALRYKEYNPQAVLVGLDTQLAQQWLAERDDKKLPDLIGISFNNEEDQRARIDLIEVKTSQDYSIDNNHIISGHAVKQAGILEDLVCEMFSRSEKITTVSRREILREQVFECVFSSKDEGILDKKILCDRLNALFAGVCTVEIRRNINRIDFDVQHGSVDHLCDTDGKEYILTVIGSREIQALITGNRIEMQSGQVLLKDKSAFKQDIGAVENDLLSNNALELESEVLETKSFGSIEKNIELNNLELEVQKNVSEIDANDIYEKCIRLNVVLKSYGISAKPVDEKLVQCANRFTRFTLELMLGETESNLIKRKEDIARELEASGEIFISRIKGTKYIAIDIPFASRRGSLSLLENLKLLDHSKGSLNFVAGQEPDGTFKIVNLETAPHMLVAGTTGSGKSVFLNSIIISLVSKHKTNDLELILIDPKQMEFYFYMGLPHLRKGKILTNPEEAIDMLEYVRTVDMPARIEKIQSSKSKTIAQHNAKCPHDKLRYLVIVIDEYSALVNAASLKGKKVRDEFEKNLCTLVFMARSYGIHLIIATQYPTATYVTSALKTNLPFRVSFRLPSHTDSMTILDRTGAEDLLGNGDMLMLLEDGLTRMQGCYVSEDEIVAMVENCKNEEDGNGWKKLTR